MTEKKITISIASEEDRDKIYHLRHEVYGTELRQHSENELKLFRDRLDDFNTYICAKINQKIVGFISITPPHMDQFSIDKYLNRKDLPFKVDEGSYEMRILTVIQEYRGRPIALALMWSAFRWIESNGGTNIMAIGRTEVLSMYLKLGFKAMQKTIKSGEVKFELLLGNVGALGTFADKNLKQLFIKLESQCNWHLAIPFFKPSECYHGGHFFKAIGNEFDNLNRRKKIINADVLDAWFDPSPKILKELNKHLSWISKTSPPTDCSGMANSIAKMRGVKPYNILPGAGSSDLIFLAFREWLTSKSHVLILDPMYGEYEHVLKNIIGCKVDRLKLFKEENYNLNPDRLVSMAKSNYDLIVIVNPNSPTGQYVSRTKLETVLKQISLPTRIWLDETYVEYTGKNQSLEKFATKSMNIIICKSMSKVYALSGLRSAYLCASPYQLEKLKSISPPWAVSLPAQIAAVIAIKDNDYYEKCYEKTKVLRDELSRELMKITTLEIIPTKANFILCYLPENGPNADFIVSKCRENGLFIRNVSNMGTNFGTHTIRIAVKDRATNHMMIKIFKKVLIKSSIRDAKICSV
ncbi:Histidinol-phosphate/aromatic aminotransferase or cobyric acid decarboxylase [Muriicola jejuensis]|uniref:Aminotransferase class I/II-fold pyridoxal phosphate-dependent enzyme n=1 Tax=Muriicola jejuensis TaxID=504488 RepID=A0A6P0UAC0_9FLAO|nr:aminotransferase class I/II-fold pyridoxal phosphate-dependent enzyme [Muriicola jejuensis]NER09440.1 aminotransferase class I/II-fold pyridoxal phosphate-dependent enzyme [Muriicola jejuensis]SMP08636.1 Histidinol-phosphate/aromatic aminotransferase or cobyric acid decarboxylase [Muriicola jejuensis]